MISLAMTQYEIFLAGTDCFFILFNLLVYLVGIRKQSLETCGIQKLYRDLGGRPQLKTHV